MYLEFIVAACICGAVEGLTKVVIPAVYKEWEQHLPLWFESQNTHEQHNFTTFLYQKNNAALPNYIPNNRGTEGAVYLRYIVEHYDKLPDFMIFTHAHPEQHAPDWLAHIGCIRPNATYSSLNSVEFIRSTTFWAK